MSEQLQNIIEELSFNEKRVLLTLHANNGTLLAEELLVKGNFNQLVEVMNACSWLQLKGLVKIEDKVMNYYSLVRKRDATKPLPERRLLKILDKHHGSLFVDEIEARYRQRFDKGELPIAIGWLKKKGWASTVKREGRTELIITTAGKRAVNKLDADELLIKKLGKLGSIPEAELEPKLARLLTARGSNFVKKSTRIQHKIFLLPEGEAVVQAGLTLREEISQLTPELIQTGKWRHVELRKYDINTYVPSLVGGKIHPLQKLINDIRRIFTELGFTEIEGNYVESCFWNMDVLFRPQDHPARDLQDTFYLATPSKIKLDDQDAKLIAKIKKIHETGWGCYWLQTQAERALLRTHTTVNTIRYLASHPEPPVKVFSIERVFRREAIDATHLPEFHQIEGIIMEPEANFRMLIGILREFYKRIGFEQIKVRPAYFPYTEPSLEVLVLYKNKWLELGGAGIFRPEVTEPFGVKYPVLAWGLGLERLAMLKLQVNDLRQFYISDLEWLRKCSLEPR